MDITNKAVLITGANRGIGRALLEEALARGAARVYAGTRTTFRHADPRVVPLDLDVTDEQRILRAVDQVESLDVLINNAGIAMPDDLSDVKSIELHLSVNVFGMLRMTQACLPLLKATGGAVVNNLSVVALAPFHVIPAYSISKAAAQSLTQSLRAQLAAHGVSVHGVFLGPVDTDINRGFDIPKAPPQDAAKGIFDGLAAREEDIFPDPMSQQLADGWRSGLVKAFERQSAAAMHGAAEAA